MVPPLYNAPLPTVIAFSLQPPLNPFYPWCLLHALEYVFVCVAYVVLSLNRFPHTRLERNGRTGYFKPHRPVCHSRAVAQRPLRRLGDAGGTELSGTGKGGVGDQGLQFHTLLASDCGRAMMPLCGFKEAVIRL